MASNASYLLNYFRMSSWTYHAGLGWVSTKILFCLTSLKPGVGFYPSSTFHFCS